ncbi:hypothetical protein [Candidatus Phyllobacterium onerii]|uniref:hypothetical protein n=1 Tax=Candidatus Phyllobacterium onerii TaxID=3020828 RepID=UPI00232A9E00|nr:hypothetical protein [Phyllobacterium sp. IY22]
MVSPAFKSLDVRLRYLSSNLPPAPATPGRLTDVEKDTVAAYAVMTSAACEQFMEDRCIQIADDAVKLYNDKSKINRVAKHLCLLPFVEVTKHEKDFATLTAVIGSPGFGIAMSKAFKTSAAVEIADVLNAGYKRYKQAVNRNHGIAFKYQLKLLAMIGVDINAFDPTFKSRIEQLSALRGEAAHRSIVAATTIPALADLPIWTTDLIVGYKSLDKVLSKLRNIAT